jgi:hypothetical protein
MKGVIRSLILALVLAGSAAAAQPPAPAIEARPLATIDFYGQRTLDADTLRKALPIHEGDRVSPGDGERLTVTVQAALSATPHLKHARVEFVCCAQDGGVHMFVGVQEDTSPEPHFRPAPTGAVRLPADLVAHSGAVEHALMEAVFKGRAQEDDSQGHALLTQDPEGRALQEQTLPLVARNLDLLKRVLRQSADGEHRAMAARFLGYAPDKQAVVEDLVQASTDPDPGVRNDATRALMVFGMAKTAPRIPYAPFVDLLDTPAWTDLNKASSILMVLSSTRDPALLTLLRRQSMPALAAMARWRDRDHSQPAYWMLGRIAGLPDPAIQDHLTRGDADGLIAAALKREPGP